MNCSFRRLREADYSALLALQEANLSENLTPEERSEGFLSVRFTREQFAAMDANVAVVVGQCDEMLAGYLCASSVEFNRRFALLAAMIESYPRLTLWEQPLVEFTSFVCGPVCVDRRFRGRGVLRGLYRALMREASGQFEIGVGFVAQENARSLAAHVEGLGMHEVGSFDFDGRHFAILAFRVEQEIR